ncbi:hypothetical protein BDZ89DRAFT_1194180 [Hymenopellis radicata]|nr:hypothetical protein BDZ89DRAFT_1194180 [Hymenopellis radicata]
MVGTWRRPKILYNRHEQFWKASCWKFVILSTILTSIPCHASTAPSNTLDDDIDNSYPHDDDGTQHEDDNGSGSSLLFEECLSLSLWILIIIELLFLSVLLKSAPE